MNSAKQTKIIYAAIGCFFVAVISVMLVTLSSSDTPPPVLPPRDIKPPEPKPEPKKRTKIEIPFPEDEPAPVVKKPAPIKAAPIPVKKKKPFLLRLRGVIVSDKPYAFIIHSTTKEGYVRNLGEVATDGWKVISIEEEAAVVQKGQQKVKMGVDGSISDISAPGATKEYDVPELTKSGEAEDRVGVWMFRSPEEIKKRLAQLKNPVPDNNFEKKSPTSFQISQKTFRRIRHDMLRYGRDWVIAPIANEKTKTIDGIKIYGVNRFSMPYTYGARPGDVIKKINDIPLNSALSIFKLVSEYQSLIHREGDSEYKVTIERLGKPVTITYRLQGN